jgi:hypothetical protein
MNNQYEVLSPWAEVDPVPLRGITPRVKDLTGKTIGLFVDVGKPGAAAAIQRVVERRLKEKLPTLKFITYQGRGEVMETEAKTEFEKWIKEVDTVIMAVGD